MNISVKKVSSILLFLMLFVSIIPVQAGFSLETDDDSGIEGYRTMCEQAGGKFVIHSNDGEFANHECIWPDGDSIDCWTDVGKIAGDSSCTLYINEDEDSSEIVINEPGTDPLDPKADLYTPITAGELAVAMSAKLPTKEQNQRWCKRNGGTVIKFEDGSWACDYPTGDDLICDGGIIDVCHWGWIVEQWVKDMSLSLVGSGEVASPEPGESETFGSNSIFRVINQLGPNALIAKERDAEIDCVVSREGIFDSQGNENALCSENLSELVLGETQIQVVSALGMVEKNCSEINRIIGAQGDVGGQCIFDQDGIVASYTPITLVGTTEPEDTYTPIPIVGLHQVLEANCPVGVIEQDGLVHFSCVDNIDMMGQLIEQAGFVAIFAPEGSSNPNSPRGIIESIQHRDILPGNNYDPTKCIPEFLGCVPDSSLSETATWLTWFGVIALAPISSVITSSILRKRMMQKDDFNGAGNGYTPITIVTSVAVGISVMLIAGFAVRGLTSSGVLNLPRVSTSAKPVAIPYPETMFVEAIESLDNVRDGTSNTALNESTLPTCADASELVAPILIYPADESIYTGKSSGTLSEVEADVVYPSDSCIPDLIKINISESADFSTKNWNGVDSALVFTLNSDGQLLYEDDSDDVPDCTSFFWKASGSVAGVDGPESAIFTFTTNFEENCAAPENPAGELEPFNPPVTAEKDANCRRGPATVFNELGFLAAGETAIVLGQNADQTWVFVQLTNLRECWVWEGTLTEDSDFSGVDTLPEPPLPVPPPAEDEPESDSSDDSDSKSSDDEASSDDESPPDPPPSSSNASISGTVFKDSNADGSSSGDDGYAGVSVNLGAGSCNSSGLASTNTSGNGGFSFSGLSAGTYCLSVVTPSTGSCPRWDHASTSTNFTINLAEDQSVSKIIGFDNSACSVD
jgi:hypothetical protein